MQRVCEVVAVTPGVCLPIRWQYRLRSELPEPRMDGLEALLIDGKHLGRAGFLTLVLNARTGGLLWLAEGRGKESLKGFFAKLSAEQKASIAAVGIARSGAYRAALETHLPAADIVLDKVHFISNFGEVIDKVRRRTQAHSETDGRAFLKGPRYNLLHSPENLSTEGGRALATLLSANRDLSVAYLLKDAFRQVWIYTYRKCADKRLTGWIATAPESGVAELKRFAKSLLEPKEQILHFCRTASPVSPSKPSIPLSAASFTRHVVSPTSNSSS